MVIVRLPLPPLHALFKFVMLSSPCAYLQRIKMRKWRSLLQQTISNGWHYYSCYCSHQFGIFIVTFFFHLQCEYVRILPFKTEKKGWGLKTMEYLYRWVERRAIGAILDFKRCRCEFIFFLPVASSWWNTWAKCSTIRSSSNGSNSTRRRTLVTTTSCRWRQTRYWMLPRPAMCPASSTTAARLTSRRRRFELLAFYFFFTDVNCLTQLSSVVSVPFQWTVNGELRIGFFTKTRVMSGEELTFDYQFQRYGLVETIPYIFLAVGRWLPTANIRWKHANKSVSV